MEMYLIKTLLVSLSLFILETYCSDGETLQDCWISEEYLGDRNWTKYGRMCQNWASQFPHSHNYGTDDNFPYDCSISDAANNCRDPSNYGRLWCYTINNEVRWEECDPVPICNIACYNKDDVGQYKGKEWDTEDGFPCQAWSEQTPHKHHFNKSDMFPSDESVLAANNYCRDPEGVGRLW